MYPSSSNHFSPFVEEVVNSLPGLCVLPSISTADVPSGPPVTLYLGKITPRYACLDDQNGHIGHSFGHNYGHFQI